MKRQKNKDDVMGTPLGYLKVIKTTLSVIFIVFIIAVVFVHSMQHSLDRDESQYITAGQLLADQNLLPYIDYHNFHLPNIIFINALVFKFTDYLLFGARSISILAFSLIIIMIYYIVKKHFCQFSYWIKLLIFLAAVNLLIGNPIVQYTIGKAWTHDIPMMLLILAFLVHLKGKSSLQPNKWFFINGLLIGLATGTRLSYGFTIFPFIIGFLILKEQNIKTKLKFITVFFFGFAVSMLPSVILFISTPENFFFDIYTFHTKIDSLYLNSREQNLNFTQICNTFYYYSKDPINIAILIGLIFMISIRILNKPILKKSVYPISLLLLLLFSQIGSYFIKDVFLKQYIFYLIPLIIIGFLFGISLLNGNSKKIAIFLFLFVSISFSNKNLYSEIENVFSPEKWETHYIHNLGKDITAITDDKYVLTLSPLLILEGNGKIYREFANNPFIWRTSHFVPKKTRDKFNIISPEELNSFLSKKPAYAILVGFEGEFDEYFLQYALDNNYKEEKIPLGRLFVIQQK